MDHGQKMQKKILDFLSKMYKKVQKKFFLHYFKIFFWASIELLALSPNPLSDLWGRIPKKSYRPRNIDKKCKIFLLKYMVRAFGGLAPPTHVLYRSNILMLFDRSHQALSFGVNTFLATSQKLFRHLGRVQGPIHYVW